MAFRLGIGHHHPPSLVFFFHPYIALSAVPDEKVFGGQGTENQCGYPNTTAIVGSGI